VFLYMADADDAGTQEKQLLVQRGSREFFSRFLKRKNHANRHSQMV
jgi:hypothetical protein